MEADMDTNQIVEKAKKDFQAGNLKAAAAGFEQALEQFRQQGNDLMAAEMANNLSVVYLKGKKKDLALQIVLGTEEVFEAHGDVVKQAMAIGNRAAALDALKRYPEAEEAYQRSADLLKGTGEDELRGYVLQSLAALQLRSGHQLDGMLSMKTGLDGREKLPLRMRILRWLLKFPFRFLGK